MTSAPETVVKWAAIKYAQCWPAEPPQCFIKGGSLLVFSGSKLLIDARLPPHAMVVADVDAWHAAHQSRRHQAETLPLFAEKEDPAAQGSLF